MTQGGIEPDKITKPIQLVATWFATLVLLVGAFLGAANTARRPSWIPVLFGAAAVLAVPFFAWLVFRLQTRYRPELQEDPYYSKYKAEEKQLKDFRPENVAGEAGEIISESPSKSTDDDIDLHKKREEIYERNRGLFLIHTWRPSQMAGQTVDISIRLYEHGKRWTPLSDGAVDRVEYYLGAYFFGGNSVTKTNLEDDFRLDISSYGSTSCVAAVYFNDGTPPVVLDRYLDSVLQTT
jgi:hypothetical protein